MGVRSRNHCISIFNVTRKNFSDIERIVRLLSLERLEMAKVKLKASGKTVNKGMNQLLKSLSFYGFRQPMFKESRLSIQ